ncbi:MAG TPA: CopD family protein [Acidimicrobiales bacterium]|nr:CopD family protein [Acidimicrobiales bacterium]
MSGAVAPAVEGVRLSLHVLAAAVWVGGQITLAGLVPAARKASPDVPGQLARAFARLSWPAFAVLVATGIWNVAAVGGHQGTAWDALLGAKLAVVALAGASAWLHSRATSRRGLAVWGALSGVSSVSALVMGVFLAG